MHYLRDKQRGFLNFVASEKVIRNFEVVEEAFNVQREIDVTGSIYGRRSLSHQVSIQICGYSWIPALQADNIGVSFESVYLINQEIQDLIIDEDDRNALKLVAEVSPKNGGRLLRVRSCFDIQNLTGRNYLIALISGSNFSISSVTRSPNCDSLLIAIARSLLVTSARGLQLSEQG